MERVKVLKENPFNVTRFSNWLEKKSFIGFTYPMLQTYVKKDGTIGKVFKPKHKIHDGVIIQSTYKDYIRPIDTCFVVITGKISGITVIDCDIISSYKQIIKDFPELANTLTIKTPNGYHIYCKYHPTPATKTDTFKSYPNVDIRNDIGIVFGPNTIRSDGKKYILLNKEQENIIAFPDNLIKDLKEKNTKKKKDKKDDNDDDSDDDFIDTQRDDIDKKELFKLMDIIGLKYLDSYSSWRDFVWACRNAGDDFRAECKRISKKSNGYSSDGFKVAWNGYNPNKSPVNFYKKIYLFAKKSNPSEFKKIINEVPEKNEEPKLDNLNRNVVKFYKVNNTSIDNIVYNEKYVLPYPIDKYSSIIIQAYMGQGKTTQIQELIKKKFDEDNGVTVLCISSRRHFANNMVAEFNKEFKDPRIKFINYLDNLKINAQFLFCSMESLHKMFTRNKPFDVVIIDECESAFSQLASNTMGEHVKESSDVFEHFIKHASLKIYADAYISNRTIEVFNNIDTSKTKVFIKNTFKAIEREAYLLNNKLALGTKILQDLRAGKNGIGFFGSKQVLLDIHKKIEEEGFKSLIYTGTESNADVQNTLKDINTHWKNVQFVGFTSTITVGLNFNIPDYFDNLYMYFSRCGGFVRDAFQGSMRARHLTSNKMYYCIGEEFKGNAGKINCLTIESAKYALKDYSNMVDNSTNYLQSIDVKKNKRKEVKQEHKWYESKDWLITNKAYSDIEQNLSQQFTEDMIMYFFAVSNYKPMGIFDITDIEIFGKKQMKKEDIVYNKIEIPFGFCPETFVVKDQESKLIFSKFFFEQTFKNHSKMLLPDKEQIFKSMLNSDFSLNTTYFYFVNMNWDEGHLLQKKIGKHNYKEYVEVLFPRIGMAKKICERLGLPNTYDTSVIIDTNNVMKREKWWKNNMHDVMCKHFGIANKEYEKLLKYPMEERIIKATNKMLEKVTSYKLYLEGNRHKDIKLHKYKMRIKTKNVTKNLNLNHYM